MSKRRDDAASVELVPMERLKDFVRRVLAVSKKDIDVERERASPRQRSSKHARRHG